MMAFFPLRTPKDAKEYEPGSKTAPKPSTSSESETDFPSFDLSLEEAQPQESTKAEHGQCPYIESSRRRSSDTGQKMHKKGLKKKIVNIFFRKGSPPRTEKNPPKQESQPLTADQIRDMIKDQQFFEACQHLLVMRKTSGGDSGSKCEDEKTDDRHEVPALFEFLKEEVLKVIHSSVVIAPVQLELLQDAVRTVAELVEKGTRSSGEEEASESTKMKEDWRRTIQASVQERMKEPSFVGIEGISTTAHSFLHMGKTMKEDLITVVQHIKPLYPEQFEVCRTYAKLYHECFSYQAQTIAQFGLDDKDTYLLLNWTLNFYPKNIINHDVLKKELDKAGLENLLPPHQIRQHEAAYLTSELDSVKRWLTKCLDFEVKRWSQEKEPEKLHGYFHSELSIDAIQSISGGQQRAEKITPELGQQASRLFLVEFHAFLQSYKKKLETFIKENKKHHYFQEIIIANINNCLSFRTYTEESTESAKNSIKENIFSVLSEIQKIGFDVLLQDLFQDLQPLFRRFTQNKWVSCGNIINEIIATTSRHVSTFKALKKPLYQAIMEKIHLQLIQEYILRLVKKKVSLRTPEQQTNLSELVQGNASMLCTFCAENGSNATWLDDVLPSLAAIIRLQDKDAIMVAVGGLVNNYPDISEKHLSAILYIKGNLSSSDKRSILSVLDIGVCATLPTTQLFSTIKVS